MRPPADVATTTALVGQTEDLPRAVGWTTRGSAREGGDRWALPVREEPVRCGLCGAWTVRADRTCERCARLVAGST